MAQPGDGWLTGRTADRRRDLRFTRPRRTALTAPLGILGPSGKGTDAEVTECLQVAATCATDPDPAVHKPVGILLKYAAQRAENAVLTFLDEHAATMPRAAVRLAAEKLPAHVRSCYVG